MVDDRRADKMNEISGARRLRDELRSRLDRHGRLGLAGNRWFKGPGVRTVSRTVAWRYGVALAAFLLSFFVRDLLNNWLVGISDRGLIIFLPAILLVTFFLGLGPVILTLLLSALAAWYFFLPPYHTFAIGTDGSIVLATFVVGLEATHYRRP